MQMRKLLVLLAVLALAGCTARYVQEKDPLKAATLVVVHRDATFPSSTKVNAYKAPTCSRGNLIGRIAHVGKALQVSEAPAVVRLRPNEKIYLAVSSASWVPGSYQAGSLTARFCIGIVGFTPRPGKRYTVWEDVAGECSTRLIDSETAQPPSDLTMHPAGKDCVDRSM